MYARRLGIVPAQYHALTKSAWISARFDGSTIIYGLTRIRSADDNGVSARPILGIFVLSRMNNRTTELLNGIEFWDSREPTIWCVRSGHGAAWVMGLTQALWLGSRAGN